MQRLEDVELFPLNFTEPAETQSAAYHAAAAAARLSSPPPPPAEAGEVITDDPPPSRETERFPTDALPEPLLSMVRHASRQTCAPESLCAAAGLGIASASIGSALRVLSGEARQTPANLYILAFANSGTGKGQSFNVMAAPWYAEGKRMMDEWALEERPRLLADLETAVSDLERGKKERRNHPGGTDAAEAEANIREAVKRKTEAENALAREPLLNIGNTTAEAIAEALALAPGEASAIISAEARDIVANLMGRYSKDGKGSDEAIFLQAYSGDTVTHKRKGKPAISLQAPCLTLCLAVQPDIWDRMAGDSRLMESGFLARSMAFNSYARPLRPSRHRIPEDMAKDWENVVVSLLSARGDPAPPSIIDPTPEARMVLDSLANESADNQEEDGEWNWCRPFAARLAENAWRLALVFHAIRHAGEAPSHRLGVETANAAVRIARWFFNETLGLLSPIRSKQETARMQKLEGVFRDKGCETLPRWILNQNHGFEEPELRRLAEAFPKRLEVVSLPTGGRPSNVARLIPPNITPP